MIVPLLLASIVDGASQNERRKALSETKQRLGIQEYVPRGISARLAWVRKDRGANVALIVGGLLSDMGYDVNSREVTAIDSFVPYFASCVAAGATIPSKDDLEYLRDYLVNIPGIKAHYYTLDTLVQQARGYADKGDGLDMVPAGRVVYDFGDGWTVQRVLTLDALHAEGESMQNCLRAEESCYDDDFSEGNVEVYSLRKPQATPNPRAPSRPAVTFAWHPPAGDDETGRFSQIKGRQNEIPHPKYHERALRFILWKTGGELPDDPDDELKPLLDALPRRGHLFQRYVLGKPSTAYWFAVNVDRGPRADTREAVLDDPFYALRYALDVDQAPREDTWDVVLHRGDAADQAQYVVWATRANPDWAETFLR